MYEEICLVLDSSVSVPLHLANSQYASGIVSKGVFFANLFLFWMVLLGADIENYSMNDWHQLCMGIIWSKNSLKIIKVSNHHVTFPTVSCSPILCIYFLNIGYIEGFDPMDSPFIGMRCPDCIVFDSYFEFVTRISFFDEEYETSDFSAFWIMFIGSLFHLARYLELIVDFPYLH